MRDPELEARARSSAVPDDGRDHALSHIGPLDGLRGIAIVVVVLFHFSWAFAETPALTRAVKHVFWTGWVGVDLFFVLSGYLITRGLLAPSTRTRAERLRLFWARRVLRIFPLYYAVVLGGTLVCLAVGARIPEASYWGYLQNYALAFDPDPERWTSHLWSLALEEQFYLLWPLVVVLLPRRALVGTTLFLLVASFCLRAGFTLRTHVYDELTTAKLVYRALPTRLDPLLLGSLVAMLEATPESRLLTVWRANRIKAIAATGLLLAGLVIWTRGFTFYDRRVIVLGYGVLALFFAGIVSLAVDRALPAGVARTLTSAPLRAIGRVSYGMYALHWPLLSLGIPYFKEVALWTSTMTALAFGCLVTAGGVLVTYGLSELSYRYFESPFLRRKTRFR